MKLRQIVSWLRVVVITILCVYDVHGITTFVGKRTTTVQARKNGITFLGHCDEQLLKL